MAKKIKTIDAKDIAYINNTIGREIRNQSTPIIKILKSVSKGTPYKEIATSLNTSPQYISQTIDKIAETISSKQKIKEILTEISKEGYIKAEQISPKYFKILEKIFILKYRKKLSYGFIVNDTMIKERSHKILYQYIDEDGFPMPTSNYGINNMYVDRVTYLIQTDKETVWMENDKGEIIGDSKKSFIANLEKWQVQNPFSLWKLYELYHLHHKAYLTKNNIETFKKFTAMLRRDNYISKKRCHIGLLEHRCKDGSPIYEVKEYLFTTSKPYLKRIEEIKKKYTNEA